MPSPLDTAATSPAVPTATISADPTRKDVKTADPSTAVSNTTAAATVALSEIYDEKSYLENPSKYKYHIKAWAEAKRFDLIEKLVKSFSASGNEVFEKALNCDDFNTQLAIIIYSASCTRAKASRIASIEAAYTKVPPTLYVKCFDEKSAAAELTCCAELGATDKNDSEYHWSVVNAMLDAFPNMDVDQPGSKKNTALHHAINAKQYGTARKISERSKNLDAENAAKERAAQNLKGYGEDQLAIAMKHIKSGAHISRVLLHYVVKLLSIYKDDAQLRRTLQEKCENNLYDPLDKYGNDLSAYNTAVECNDGQSLAIMICHTAYKYLSYDSHCGHIGHLRVDFVTEFSLYNTNDFSKILDLLIVHGDANAILKYLEANRFTATSITPAQEIKLFVLLANSTNGLNNRIYKIRKLNLNSYTSALDKLISNNNLLAAAKLMSFIHNVFELNKYDNHGDEKQKADIIMQAVAKYVTQSKKPANFRRAFNTVNFTRLTLPNPQPFSELQNTLALLPNLDSKFIYDLFTEFYQQRKFEEIVALNEALIAIGKQDLAINMHTGMKYLEELAGQFHDQLISYLDSTKTARSASITAPAAATTAAAAASTGDEKEDTAFDMVTTQASRDEFNKRQQQEQLILAHKLLLQLYNQLITVHGNKPNNNLNDRIYKILIFLLQDQPENDELNFLSVNFPNDRDACLHPPMATTIIAFGGLDINFIAITLTYAKNKATRAKLIGDYSTKCTAIHEFILLLHNANDWHGIASLDCSIRINADVFAKIIKALVADNNNVPTNMEHKVNAIQKLCVIYHTAANDQINFIGPLRDVIGKNNFSLARAMFIHGAHLLPAKEIPVVVNELFTKYATWITAAKADEKHDKPTHFNLAKATIDYEFLGEVHDHYYDYWEKKPRVVNAEKEAVRELLKHIVLQLLEQETDHIALRNNFLPLHGYDFILLPLLQERQGSSISFAAKDTIILPDGSKLYYSSKWREVRTKAQEKAAHLLVTQLGALTTTLTKGNLSDKNVVANIFKQLHEVKLTHRSLNDNTAASNTVNLAFIEFFNGFKKLSTEKADQLLMDIAQDMVAEARNSIPDYSEFNFREPDSFVAWRTALNNPAKPLKQRILHALENIPECIPQPPALFALYKSAVTQLIPSKELAKAVVANNAPAVVAREDVTDGETLRGVFADPATTMDCNGGISMVAMGGKANAAVSTTTVATSTTPTVVVPAVVTGGAAGSQPPAIIPTAGAVVNAATSGAPAGPNNSVIKLAS